MTMDDEASNTIIEHRCRKDAIAQHLRQHELPPLTKESLLVQGRHTQDKSAERTLILPKLENTCGLLASTNLIRMCFGGRRACEATMLGKETEWMASRNAVLRIQAGEDQDHVICEQYELMVEEMRRSGALAPASEYPVTMATWDLMSKGLASFTLVTCNVLVCTCEEVIIQEPVEHNTYIPVVIPSDAEPATMKGVGDVASAFFKAHATTRQCPQCAGSYERIRLVVGRLPKFIMVEWCTEPTMGIKEADLRTITEGTTFSYHDTTLTMRIAALGKTCGLLLNSNRHTQSLECRNGCTKAAQIRDWMITRGNSAAAVVAGMEVRLAAVLLMMEEGTPTTESRVYRRSACETQNC